MKSNYILFIICSFLYLTSCKPSPESILLKYEKAHNEGDTEKELSYYHEEIEFELKGTWIKKGIIQMQELAEWDAALNSNLDITILEKRDDSFICKVVEKNDWFKRVGIEKLVHEPTYLVIQDQKIRKILAIPSEQVGQDIYRAITKLYQWSAENEDSTIHRLIPNGEFVYSSEAAAEWMRLFDRMGY